MKRFDFTGSAVYTVKGYVYAETQEEARAMLNNDEWGDIYDSNMENLESFTVNDGVKDDYCHELEEEEEV